jgi:hypothetical protein
MHSLPTVAGSTIISPRTLKLLKLSLSPLAAKSCPRASVLTRIAQLPRKVSAFSVQLFRSTSSAETVLDSEEGVEERVMGVDSRMGKMPSKLVWIR